MTDSSPKPRAKRTRRDNLQLAKDALPTLSVDQLAEVCESLVHTSPRQALLLQTVLKETLDEAKGGRSAERAPRTAAGGLD